MSIYKRLSKSKNTPDKDREKEIRESNLDRKKDDIDKRPRPTEPDREKSIKKAPDKIEKYINE